MKIEKDLESLNSNHYNRKRRSRQCSNTKCCSTSRNRYFYKLRPEELVIETMLSKVPAKVADVNKKAYELGKKYALECLNK